MAWFCKFGAALLLETPSARKFGADAEDGECLGKIRGSITEGLPEFACVQSLGGVDSRCGRFQRLGLPVGEINEKPTGPSEQSC
mmetsp:Transcript_40912/g.95033  ORF Transcript_40912/g.95033 Transcript_40912/m.95033 type:complete len:84 (-) Transcript_40912:1978-2229(-)